MNRGNLLIISWFVFSLFFIYLIFELRIDGFDDINGKPLKYDDSKITLLGNVSNTDVNISKYVMFDDGVYTYLLVGRGGSKSVVLVSDERISKGKKLVSGIFFYPEKRWNVIIPGIESFIYVEEVKDYRRWNDYGLSDISLYLILTYVVLLAVFGFLENRRKRRKN